LSERCHEFNEGTKSRAGMTGPCLVKPFQNFLWRTGVIQAVRANDGFPPFAEVRPKVLNDGS
jgi:hypothetical protein